MPVHRVTLCQAKVGAGVLGRLMIDRGRVSDRRQRWRAGGGGGGGGPLGGRLAELLDVSLGQQQIGQEAAAAQQAFHLLLRRAEGAAPLPQARPG